MNMIHEDLRPGDYYILKGRRKEIRRCIKVTEKSVLYQHITGDRKGHVAWSHKLARNGTNVPVQVELVDYEEAAE